MEQFNSKLYSKYQNLKKRKGFEEEEWIQKLDSDLRNSKLATEALIQELKSENDRLLAEISSMQERYAECQKLLFQESQKTRQLSIEVGRLENLLAQRTDANDAALLRSPISSPIARSKDLSGCSPKRITANTSYASPEARSRYAPLRSQRKRAPNSGTLEARVQSNGAGSIQNDNSQRELVVPDCCRRDMTRSWVTARKACHSCVFQTLMEYLVGMKFSIGSEDDGLRLSAIHPMSGYTFNLTINESEDGHGCELMYRVSSLGTLERVAVDWMKEEIIFSMTMCRLFFERISQVIGHH